MVEGREEKPFRDAMASLGLTPRPVATIEGLNYSDGDEERLTLYRGEPRAAAPAPPAGARP